MQQAVSKSMPSAVHDGTATRLNLPHACPCTTSTRNPCGVPPANQPCSQRVVANPAPAWRRPKRCPNVALLHVASGSHVVSADVASKRCVACSCGVREPAGIARCGLREQGGVDVASKRVVTCPRGARELGGIAKYGIKIWRHLFTRRGVKTWRHLPTWHQGARWRHQMWRQNVTSLTHAMSGSQCGVARRGVKTGVTCPRGVREPGVASKRGVTCARGAREPGGARRRHQMRRQNTTSLTHAVSGNQVASDVASKRGACLRGVREPGGLVRCGVKTWRHLLTWHEGTRWRQNVESLRGVKAWRHLPA